jgi:hypothetical protein
VEQLHNPKNQETIGEGNTSSTSIISLERLYLEMM